MGHFECSSTAREASASADPVNLSPPAIEKHTGAQRYLCALFRVVWVIENVLLVLSALGLVYAALWEYSTRRYLSGFSDAITPAGASDRLKTQAILNWMASGPGRRNAEFFPELAERNPVDTLNYAALLRVCGSATNAFVNLADVADLKARRLLLLNPRGTTKHVVAEVMLDGRWVVVDPTFRVMLQASDGRLLTRQELSDRKIFIDATGKIPGYDPSYTFDRTTHIRFDQGRLFVRLIRRTLDLLVPAWEGSPTISLIAERTSLATLAIAFALVAGLSLLRMLLLWWREHYPAVCSGNPLHRHRDSTLRVRRIAAVRFWRT